MNNIKKLFLAASALFAAVPGFAVMWKGIGTPPDYAYLFGGVIEAFGSLSLIILWANKNKIKRLSTKRITKLAIRLGVLAFLFLVLYIFLYSYCVKAHPTHDTVFYPLWTSGRLAELVKRAGGRWEALDKYGFWPIYNGINAMPTYARVITVSILLFVYQAIFSTLSLAFGLVGFHKGEE
jgi:hypothetical protein